MKITKKQLEYILLKEFKETKKDTTPLELSVLLTDISSEIASNYDDTQSFLEQQFSSNKKNLNESLSDYIASLFKKKESQPDTLPDQGRVNLPKEDDIVDDFDIDDNLSTQGDFVDNLSKGKMKRRDFLKTGIGIGALGATGGIIGNELGVFDSTSAQSLSDIQMPYTNPGLRSQAYDHPILYHIESYLVENFGDTARFYKFYRHEDKSWPDIKFPDPGPIHKIQSGKANEKFQLTEREKSLARYDEFGITAAAKILGKRTEAVMGFDAEANLEAYEEFFKLIKPMIDERSSIKIDTPSFKSKFYIVEVQGKKIIYFNDFGLTKIYF